MKEFFAVNYKNLLSILSKISPSFCQNLHYMLCNISKCERKKLAQLDCMGNLYFDNYKDFSFKFVGETEGHNSIFLRVVKGELASVYYELSVAKTSLNLFKTFADNKEFPICSLEKATKYGNKKFSFTLRKNGNDFYIFYYKKPYNEAKKLVSIRKIDIFDLCNISNFENNKTD